MKKKFIRIILIMAIDTRRTNDENSVSEIGFSDDDKKFYLKKLTYKEPLNADDININIGYHEVYEIEE